MNSYPWPRACLHICPHLKATDCERLQATFTHKGYCGYHYGIFLFRLAFDFHSTYFIWISVLYISWLH